MVEGNNEIEGNEIEGPVVEGKVIEGDLIEGIALPRLARELWRRRGRSMFSWLFCGFLAFLAKNSFIIYRDGVSVIFFHRHFPICATRD